LKKDWLGAAITCHLIDVGIFAVNPGMSFYDIRLRCPNNFSHDCYNFTNAVRYISQPAIRSQLGVAQNLIWGDVEVPFGVISAVNGDEESSYQQLIPPLLEKFGIRVLFYNGEFDFAANYLGGESWLAQLEWEGQALFNMTQMSDWNVEGQIAGIAKSVQNLTLVRVYNSGHMVPMNVPENALELFRTFILNEPFTK